jgi:hypothetical protein
MTGLGRDCVCQVSWDVKSKRTQSKSHGTLFPLVARIGVLQSVWDSVLQTLTREASMTYLARMLTKTLHCPSLAGPTALSLRECTQQLSRRISRQRSKSGHMTEGGTARCCWSLVPYPVTPSLGGLSLQGKCAPCTTSTVRATCRGRCWGKFSAVLLPSSTSFAASFPR